MHVRVFLFNVVEFSGNIWIDVCHFNNYVKRDSENRTLSRLYKTPVAHHKLSELVGNTALPILY
jgi:hypothetical protein